MKYHFNETEYSIIFIVEKHLSKYPYFYNFLLLLLLFERPSLHLGAIVHFVAARKFKVCLSVGLNICLGYK